MNNIKDEFLNKFVEEIDACIFSSDILDDGEDLEEFTKYLLRWTKKCNEIKEENNGR